MNYDQIIAREKAERKKAVEADFDFVDELEQFIQKEYGMIAKHMPGQENIVQDTIDAVEKNDEETLKSVAKSLKTRISYLYEKREDEEEYRYVIKLQLMLEEIKNRIKNNSV